VIKSLVERMRLPRLGVIRLGIKQTNARGVDYPSEVPYFVVPDDLKGVLDPQPTRIPVLFPSDDPERVLACDYIRYQGKLLTLKCDGETFHEIAPSGQEATGRCRKVGREKCPCGAEAKARLNVIVLDGPLGIYQVLIGGEQRIADLLSELLVFRQTLGRLTEILFYLERVPTEIQVKKDDGSRLARTGWPVHIRCDFTAKQALRARGLTVLGAGEPRAALPAAPPEEEETEAVHELPEEEMPEAEGRGAIRDERPAAPMTPVRAGQSGGSEPHPSRVPPGDARPPRLPDPSDSAPRAESRPAEIETPLLDSPAEEWTVERVVGRATFLGVGPGTFKEYVACRFRGLVLDDLGAPQLQTLGQEMTAAEAGGPKARADWKLKILTTLKEAAQAKRRAVTGAAR
jgi:hypothetical protein